MVHLKISIRYDRGRDSDSHDHDERHWREFERGSWSFQTTSEATREKPPGCHTRIRK